MVFSLFKSKPAKNKDNFEAKQNLDIKEATINSPPLFPNSNSNTPIFPQTTQQDTNSQIPNNFNNPFAIDPSLNAQTPQFNNSINIPTNQVPSQIPNPITAPQNNFSQTTISQNSPPITPNFVNSPTQDSIPTPSFEPVKPIPDIDSNLANDLRDKNSSLDKFQIKELIDETVEKLIDEKWEKLISSVEKVLSWKEAQENQVNLLKEDLVRMSTDVEKIESKILNKISSYDRNILDVNSEIKALDKVFQKITPTLINNVNELSKIAEDFKDLKPKIKNF